jgi:hypothetical protein
VDEQRLPACSRPRSNTFVQTVKNVSGMAAAAIRSSPLGTGRHCGAGAAQYSAYPLPRPAHRPRRRCASRAPPGPAVRSSPPLRGRDVRGAGRRRVASEALKDVGRLTPAAVTLISTSPAAGTGVGRSTGTSSSGPPGARISIAIMLLAKRRRGRRRLEDDRRERNPERERDGQDRRQGAVAATMMPSASSRAPPADRAAGARATSAFAPRRGRTDSSAR